MFYIYYEDEGGQGINPQCMSITSPWKKLFTAFDWDVVRDLTRNLNNLPTRKNPKVRAIFSDVEKEANDYDVKYITRMGKDYNIYEMP